MRPTPVVFFASALYHPRYFSSDLWTVRSKMASKAIRDFITGLRKRLVGVKPTPQSLAEGLLEIPIIQKLSRDLRIHLPAVNGACLRSRPVNTCATLNRWLISVSSCNH